MHNIRYLINLTQFYLALCLSRYGKVEIGIYLLEVGKDRQPSQTELKSAAKNGQFEIVGRQTHVPLSVVVGGCCLVQGTAGPLRVMM